MSVNKYPKHPKTHLLAGKSITGLPNDSQVLSYNQSSDTSDYVDASSSSGGDTNIIKQRSFIFTFGNTATSTGSVGITAINGSLFPFTTPTSFSKDINMDDTFGVNFFGTNSSKIIVQLTVLQNIFGFAEDLMDIQVRNINHFIPQT